MKDGGMERVGKDRAGEEGDALNGDLGTPLHLACNRSRTTPSRGASSHVAWRTLPVLRGVLWATIIFAHYRGSPGGPDHHWGKNG